MATDNSPTHVVLASNTETTTSPATVSSLGDGFSANSRFIELQKELRFVLSAGVNSLAPSRAASPIHDNHQSGTQGGFSSSYDAAPSTVPATRPAQFDHQQASNVLATASLPRNIPKLKAIRYLVNWITECAGFLDKFDEQQHFGIHVPILAQRSPALLHAMLAFSARQTERKNAVTSSFDSLELYQESIRLLGPSLQARDPQVLVTVCILACLELMSGSPRDWKRHLEGCASLFDCFGITGFSGGVLQAVFWCYARMELCGVIISNYLEPTVLPLTQWTPSMLYDHHFSPTSAASPSTSEAHEQLVHDLFRERSLHCPDMHANWAVYLCTKACDLVRRRVRLLEFGDRAEQDGRDVRPFDAQWRALWAELSFWLDHRPPELQPISITGGKARDSDSTSSAQELFPQVFYTHWAAISSNQLYHTACIILLDTVSLGRPDLPSIPGSGPSSSSTHSRSLIWHAKQVCGISLTNPHLGNLVNAIQPLYIAGKHLSHLEEHLAIGRLLKKVDRSTGWGALWRLRDLEAIWGYDYGEIMSAV